MTRFPAVCAVLLVVSGCAGTATRSGPPPWQPGLDEMARTQARLELRLEEVTRNLLVLRERLDAQEAALKDLQAQQAPAAPPKPLRVVRLEAPPSPAPAARGPAEPGSAPVDLYRKAFNAYREGRFGQAILDFEEFLRRYPDHEYADNAQYWIGESYYSQGEYGQAVVEFQRVIERYPQESKAPDALLKIGLAYDRLGDKEKARVFWSRVVDRHPDTEAARQARKLLDEGG